jgi:hypothetical protein
MLRKVYNNCGNVRLMGVPGEKNESGGCEFVFTFKAWLRLALFNFMGYLIRMGNDIHLVSEIIVNSR